MKIEYKRFDHVMICIPEGTESDARNFYGKVLGLKELKDLGYQLPHNAIWFEIGDAQIHLRAEKDTHKISQRHPAFEISNLAQAKEILEAQGVVVKYESEIPGRNRFSFRDPFGNRIEFLEMTN